jgi:hypothetical protein
MRLKESKPSMMGQIVKTTGASYCGHVGGDKFRHWRLALVGAGLNLIEADTWHEKSVWVDLWGIPGHESNTLILRYKFSWPAETPSANSAQPALRVFRRHSCSSVCQFEGTAPAGPGVG